MYCCIILHGSNRHTLACNQCGQCLSRSRCLLFAQHTHEIRSTSVCCCSLQWPKERKNFEVLLDRLRKHGEDEAGAALPGALQLQAFLRQHVGPCYGNDSSSNSAAGTCQPKGSDAVPSACSAQNTSMPSDASAASTNDVVKPSRHCAQCGTGGARMRCAGCAKVR